MPSQYLEHDWFSQPLPANVTLGERTWLYSSYAFAHYSSRAVTGLCVGRDTGLYHGTFFDLGPDAVVQIGDFCSLVGVILATNGRVTIGSYSFIAHEVVIADGDWTCPSHFPRETDLEHACKSGGATIQIGQNVWIGARVSVIGSLTIGDGAIIGAGTVVMHDVPAYTLCAGSPMRVVRAIPRPAQKD